MFSSTAAATVALAFVSHVHAHMVMTNPVPYNFKDLNSSPLGEGIAFPCHAGGRYHPDYSTKGETAEAGKPINVKFEGSAVHGGGACQFSVAYLENGVAPTDRSQWKVIHTIASGCPAEAAQNLVTSGTDANERPTGPQCPPGQESTGKECVRSYNVVLPKDMKNGEAVFAWTWFNNVGNREMYMNCAPIKITGGVEDDTGVSALPSIFAGNVPGTFDCETNKQGGVAGIPQAFVGSSVDGTIDFGANLGSCEEAVVNGFGSGAGNGGGNGNTTPPPTEAAPAPPQNPGNAFAPIPSPEPAPVNPPAEPQPPAEAPSQPETPAQPPAETAPAPGAAGSVPCTSEGAIVCIGDSQWGLCNHGSAVPQALAAGTVCGSGAISAKAAKRHLHRHLRPHPRSFR